MEIWYAGLFSLTTSLRSFQKHENLTLIRHHWYDRTFESVVLLNTRMSFIADDHTQQACAVLWKEVSKSVKYV